jgi:hypothetical protein
LENVILFVFFHFVSQSSVADAENFGGLELIVIVPAKSFYDCALLDVFQRHSAESDGGSMRPAIGVFKEPWSVNERKSLAVAEYEQHSDDVAKLSNVARPVELTEIFYHSGVEARYASACLMRIKIDEMPDEVVYVAFSVS